MLSCDSNYIVDLGISSISMREVIKTSTSEEFDQKNKFFMGDLGPG